MGTKIRIPDALAADLEVRAALRGVTVEEYALEILRTRNLDGSERASARGEAGSPLPDETSPNP